MQHAKLIVALLDQYHADLGYYPGSLEELADEEYVREVPWDPMTQSREWDLVFDDGEDLADLPETEIPEDFAPGIIDVHTLSEELALDETPYAEW